MPTLAIDTSLAHANAYEFEDQRRLKTMFKLICVTVLVGLIVAMTVIRGGDNDAAKMAAMRGGEDADLAGIAAGDPDIDRSPSRSMWGHYLDDFKANPSAFEALPSCDVYTCLDERHSNSAPMFPGQAVCKGDHRLALTPQGTFLWYNCNTKYVNSVLYNLTDSMLKDNGLAKTMRRKSMDMLYWELLPNATIQVGQYSSKSKNSDAAILWQRDTTRKEMHFSKRCLSNPTMDCPYYHLRKSGAIVVNWIHGDSGKWMARTIDRCYDGMPPSP